jgi:hypothetical protein
LRIIAVIDMSFFLVLSDRGRDAVSTLIYGDLAMGGGAAFGAGVGGRVSHIGHMYGYSEDWMASTKKTIEDELRSRGIAPETISEVTSKIQEPPSVFWPVLTAILATALVCTIIFAIVWENT